VSWRWRSASIEDRSKFKGSRFKVFGLRVVIRAINKKDESFKDFVLDQLQELDNVEARGMFGGYGLYREETFFGIIHKGRLYFKIDDSTVGEYRKYKMKPFRPNVKQTLKSYYQVPGDIMEDGDRLCQWAMKAIRCQQRKK
jgi:DNA transformation protein